MNKFFRPANLSDFENLDFPINMYHKLSDSHKELIKQDELMKATKQIREEYFVSLTEAKKIVMAYKHFLDAKRDFESGKPVFVPYGSEK